MEITVIALYCIGAVGYMLRMTETPGVRLAARVIPVLFWPLFTVIEAAAYLYDWNAIRRQYRR